MLDQCVRAKFRKFQQKFLCNSWRSKINLTLYRKKKLVSSTFSFLWPWLICPAAKYDRTLWVNCVNMLQWRNFLLRIQTKMLMYSTTLISMMIFTWSTNWQENAIDIYSPSFGAYFLRLIHKTKASTIPCGS